MAKKTMVVFEHIVQELVLALDHLILDVQNVMGQEQLWEPNATAKNQSKRGTCSSCGHSGKHHGDGGCTYIDRRTCSTCLGKKLLCEHGFSTNHQESCSHGKETMHDD